MAEQFANLFSTTLASGYTAGSGSISVVSASGAPSVGTFTLVIRDSSTKAIKLLFRVTSVSGTTFTGASEGTDASANAGDLVDGTMITVASLAQFKADILASVANPFIQALTAPVAANFSQKNFNVGSGVVSTQQNLSSPVQAITLIQHDPNATNNAIALAKAKINALFTVTIAFTIRTPPGTNGCGGLWLSDGSGGPNIIWWTVSQGGFGERVSTYSSFTAFSADLIAPIHDPLTLGPLVWMRIQETASARIYSVSSDGVNWAQIRTESNVAQMTTAQYGWAIANRTASSSAPDAMMTVYHFTETTP